ncbi:hypothetical protein XL92_002569 [Salmonella enterica subsp. enterica]|nr:hypothetical protein [Salmonella enterica subsp. enterica]
MTVNLHQNWLFQSTTPDRASLESRNAGASDARSPFDLHQKTQLRQLTAGS